MESELTDEDVTWAAEHALDGSVVRDYARALLAARARIAELERDYGKLAPVAIELRTQRDALERDLADARAKLGQAERENELLSGNMNALADAWLEGVRWCGENAETYWEADDDALPNPYAPAGEEKR